MGMGSERNARLIDCVMSVLSMQNGFYDFYITNGYFTALHGYASVSLAAATGETPAYPQVGCKATQKSHKLFSTHGILCIFYMIFQLKECYSKIFM